ADGVRVQLAGADRQVQGERIAGAGAVAVRGHHPDLVAGAAQAFGENADPGRVDAVVIAYKYAHSGFLRRCGSDDTGSIRALRLMAGPGTRESGALCPVPTAVAVAVAVACP